MKLEKKMTYKVTDYLEIKFDGNKYYRIYRDGQMVGYTDNYAEAVDMANHYVRRDEQ